MKLPIATTKNMRAKKLPLLTSIVTKASIVFENRTAKAGYVAPRSSLLADGELQGAGIRE